MTSKVIPFLVASIWLLGASPVSAENPHRISLGASAGHASFDEGSGPMLGLRAEMVLGLGASLRLDAGRSHYSSDFDLTSIERTDHRIGATLLVNLGALELGAVSLTPHLDFGLGVTGTQIVFDGLFILPEEEPSRDWRPHAEAGGGLRVSLSHFGIDVTGAHGIRRKTPDVFILGDGPQPLDDPGVFGHGPEDRERYTHVQVSGFVRF